MDSSQTRKYLRRLKICFCMYVFFLLRLSLRFSASLPQLAAIRSWFRAARCPLYMATCLCGARIGEEVLCVCP